MPESVFLTKDGHAKILDFGLARQRAPLPTSGETNSPTLSAFSALTDAGTVLGTVAYMSPEQASGKPVDHRSDQFALGVVLYEMLTGKRPFGGATAAETLTAIIREEPEPLEAGAPKAPAPVRWLVDRLLAKDPHGRYESTRDLARELKTLSLHASGSGMSTGSASRAGEGQRSWRTLPGTGTVALAAVCILTGVLATVSLLKGSARTPSPPVRFEIRLPEGHYLTGARQPFSLSPDGKLLVFSAFTWKTPFEQANPSQLFLRPLDSLEARPIPGTERGFQPVFSPDGLHVAFFFAGGKEGRALKRVPVAGGAPVTICKCDARFGSAWSENGSILFASEVGPLQKVPDAGGTPEPATTLDVSEHEVSHRLPHLLPDGRTVVYTAVRWPGVWKKARIFAQRIGEKERSLLIESGSDGRWAPPGNLLFAREGRLLAAPLDRKSLRLSGKPVPILEGVRHAIWTGSSSTDTGAAPADLAGARVFAWVPGSVDPEKPTSLAWLDASGRETPLDLPKGPYYGGRVSPDGERLLVSYNYPGRQLEVLDLARGGRRNVTFGMNPGFAIWGPGPDRITFTSDHEGPTRIHSRKIDAAPDQVETLWDGAGGSYIALGSWSRDGKTLAFLVYNEKTDHDIWLLETGKEPRPFLATQFPERFPDISPDGRWLLYTSEEPGREEVFVRLLSGEGSPRQISVGGGSDPLWSRDGSTIFYRALEQQPTLMVATFRVRVRAAGAGLSLDRPERLFGTENLSAGSPGQSWDVAPDGRFVVTKQVDPADRRAWKEKVISDRIHVDLDGLPAILEGARKGR